MQKSCPNCKQQSLFFDERTHSYECLNLKCKHKFSQEEIDAILDTQAENANQHHSQQLRHLSSAQKFALRLLHSIGRSFFALAHVKTFISLIAIVGFIDLVRRAYVLFTNIKDQTSAVIGAILFLVELGLWFWLVHVLRTRRYAREKPSFKLVLACICGIVLVLTFAGVEPLRSYKNTTLEYIAGKMRDVSSGTFPSTSKGPADLQANVAIVEGVCIEDNGQVLYTKVSDDTHVSWIVDISVRNNGYKNPVSGNLGNWILVTSENTYSPSGFIKYLPPDLNVEPGQSGSTTLRFYVPRSLEITGAQLKYQGEEPNCYTSLGGNNAVVGLYDISNKIAVDTGAYLKVVDIWGIDLGLFGVGIFVQLESTPTTQIGRYDVTLYTDRESFGTKTIDWAKGQELAKVDWGLDPTARPLAELARGKTCKDVFQVKIAFNPY